jgi:hypothetical protein
VLNSPDSTIINSCDYVDQAAVDAAFATWLSQFSVSGGCNPTGNYGQPTAPELCSGGTTTVTYVITDLCVTTDVTETFTVVPASKLVITCPTDRVVECGEDANTIFAQWKDGFSYSGGCVNVTVTDLSQYVMPAPGEPLIITYQVSDNCQTVSCTARFLINECAFCTYTQGYYGNPKGSACTPEGTTTNAKTIMINALTVEEGEFDFGSITTGNYFKLKLTDVTSNNIFRMLPGGGTPRSLVGYSTYSVASTWSDNDPLNAGGAQMGKINNNLLSQTMVLFFNTRLSTELGDFNLSNTFVTADTNCGSHEAISGTEQLFTIPQPVIDYLDGNGGATVSNLFTLANKALGGENIGNLNASQINAAVDAINRGFDGCRVYVGTTMSYEIIATTLRDNSSAAAGTKDVMSVKVYPNPYSDNFNVSLTTTREEKVSVVVYDMIGRVIETRVLNPNDSKEISIGNQYPSGVYNVVVTQGEEVKALRVIRR